MTEQHYGVLKSLFDRMIGSRCENDTRTVFEKAKDLIKEGQTPRQIAERLTTSFQKMYDWEDGEYQNIAKSGDLFYIRTMATEYAHEVEALVSYEKRLEREIAEHNAKQRESDENPSFLDKLLGKPALSSN